VPAPEDASNAQIEKFPSAVKIVTSDGVINALGYKVRTASCCRPFHCLSINSADCSPECYPPSMLPYSMLLHFFGAATHLDIQVTGFPFLTIFPVSSRKDLWEEGGEIVIKNTPTGAASFGKGRDNQQGPKHTTCIILLGKSLLKQVNENVIVVPLAGARLVLATGSEQK